MEVFGMLAGMALVFVGLARLLHGGITITIKRK